MNFVAFDVETANADLASICQIGLVVFEDGAVVESWEALVNPEEYFDSTNVSVHGISSHTVKDSPTFPMIFDRLSEVIGDRVVAHHTAFDKVSLARVSRKYGLGDVDCRWIDTARVARRCWSHYASSGYGLKNVAKDLGIVFNHHAAGEDARAAGEILIHAIRHSGLSLEDWMIHSRTTKAHVYEKSRKGDPDGPLAGEVIVFTGSLTMTRPEAIDLAARAGCDVGGSVTKATTIVVVGGRDILNRSDGEKSNKHRKAEESISKGQALRILAEDDFKRLLEST